MRCFLGRVLRARFIGSVGTAISDLHSGSVIDVLYTVGSSLAIIGLMVLLFDVAMVGQSNRMVEIVRCAGAAPLDHLLSLHVIVSGVLLLTAILGMPESGEFVIRGGRLNQNLAVQVLGALMIGAVLAVMKRKVPWRRSCLESCGVPWKPGGGQ